LVVTPLVWIEPKGAAPAFSSSMSRHAASLDADALLSASWVTGLPGGCAQIAAARASNAHVLRRLCPDDVGQF